MAINLLELHTPDVRMQCQMALVSEPACPTSEVLLSVHPGSNLPWVASFLLGILQPLIAILFPLPLVHLEFFSTMWAKKRSDYDRLWLTMTAWWYWTSFVSNGCPMRLMAVASWPRCLPMVKGWRYIIGIIYVIYVYIYTCIYKCYIHYMEIT